MKRTSLSVNFFLIAFNICCLAGAAFAQEPLPADSAGTGGEEADTIIIYQEPVTITKTVVVHQEKPDPSGRFFLEAGVSAFGIRDYYYVCPNCENYFDRYQASVKNSLSYSGGFRLNYMPKRFAISAGLFYTRFREKFHDDSTGMNTNNAYHYLDLSLGFGYRIARNRLSYIFSVYGVLSRLMDKTGKTLAEDPGYLPDDIENVRKYNRYTWSINPAVKALYRLAPRLSLLLELYYKGDLTSVIADYEPFAQQRNSIGVRTGAMYHF